MEWVKQSSPLQDQSSGPRGCSHYHMSILTLCRRWSPSAGPCAKGSSYYTYLLLNIYWIKQKLSEYGYVLFITFHRIAVAIMQSNNCISCTKEVRKILFTTFYLAFRFSYYSHNIWVTKCFGNSNKNPFFITYTAEASVT